MTSGLGFVNSFGGKTVLSSGNNSDTISVTLPDQGGTLLTSANGVLAGTIQPFAFKTAPIGWLVCDGTKLKKATYPELFAAIGTTFDVGGEAADEFRIPDMGGQFLRGWHSGQTVDAGRVFGTQQEDTWGPLNDPGHSHTQSYLSQSPPGSDWQGGSPYKVSSQETGIAKTGIVAPGTETRPDNIAVLFCIYAGQTAQFYTTQSSGSGTPAGVVMHSAGNKAPTGWLICDGASVSQTVYSALFDAIGKTYGGDATNFNLPDLRGEFIRGWDDARGVDSGRAFGSSQADGVGPIGIYDPGHAHGYVHCFDNEASAAGGGSPTRGSPRGDTTSGSGSNVSITGTIAETRPKNVALLPIIKY